MECHDLNFFATGDDEIGVDEKAVTSTIQPTRSIESSVSPLRFTQNRVLGCSVSFQTSSGVGTHVTAKHNPAAESAPLPPSSLELSIQSRTPPFNDSRFNVPDYMPSSQLGQGLPSAPHTESTTIALNSDSLDASDVAFSKELLLSPHSSSTSSDESVSMFDFDTVVNNEALHELCPARYHTSSANNNTDSGSSLCEDICSRLYHDYDDERFTRRYWYDVDEEERRALSIAVTSEDLEALEGAQRNGALENWTYDSPFEVVSVQMDYINQTLESRFLAEANNALERALLVPAMSLKIAYKRHSRYNR